MTAREYCSLFCFTIDPNSSAALPAQGDTSTPPTGGVPTPAPGLPTQFLPAYGIVLEDEELRGDRFP